MVWGSKCVEGDWWQECIPTWCRRRALAGIHKILRWAALLVQILTGYRNPHMVPQTYFSRSCLNTVRDSFYFVTADRLGSEQICPSLSFPKFEHGMHMGESTCFYVRHLLIPNNRVQTLLLLDVYSFDTFSTFPSHSYRINFLFIYCMILENGSDFCLLPNFKSVGGKIKYKQHFYGSDDCNFLYEKPTLVIWCSLEGPSPDRRKSDEVESAAPVLPFPWTRTGCFCLLPSLVNLYELVQSLFTTPGMTCISNISQCWKHAAFLGKTTMKKQWTRMSLLSKEAHNT